MANNIYEYRFRVSLHDTDAAGVLFFGHLFRHAHDAYETFMADIGFSLDGILHEGRYHLPLGHAEADYLLPLRHGEQVLVKLQVNNLSSSSFALEYHFFNEDGNALATAKTVHVLVDRDAQSRPSLPDGLRAALERYIAG